MDIRRLVLRVSLASLAVTALSGATLLVFPMGSVAGRFTLTCLFATVVVALCLPFALWAARADSRWGGLAGILFLCAELLLAIAVMWWPILLVTSADDEIFSAMVYIAAAAPFCILGARELVRRRRVGVVAVTTSLLGLGSLLIHAFVCGGFEYWDRDVRVYPIVGWTTIVAGGAAALGLVRARMFLKAFPPSQHWPFLGTLSAIVAFGFALWAAYLDIRSNGSGYAVWRQAWMTAGVAIIFAYAIGIANLLLLPRLASWGFAVQAISAGFALVVASIASAWIITDDETTFGTALGAALVVLLCGSLAVMLMAKFMAEPTLVSDLGIVDGIEVLCPRCRRRKKLPLGASSCDSCGLRFRIAVEEPRCVACNHLLAHLTSDRCPECGTPVAAPSSGGIVPSAAR